MELLIDIGNTNCVLGVGSCAQKIIEHSFRISSSSERTIDELEVLTKSFLAPYLDRLELSVLCSVVPRLTGDFTRVMQRLGLKVMSIESDNPHFVDLLGLQETIPVPALLGADRLANGMAARSLYGKNTLVIDLGTATTFDIIDDRSRFRAGPIAIGPKLSLDALSQRAARLPFIELVWPSKVLGSSTTEAMQAGVVRGYLHLIDGLAREIEQELELSFASVVATGGLGRMFSEHSKCITHYIPDLTLQGIQFSCEYLRSKSIDG